MKRAFSVALAVLLAASCSLGPREDWANAIADANDFASRATTAKAQLTIALEVIESVARSKPDLLAKTMKGVVDFADGTSRMTSVTPNKRLDLYIDDLAYVVPRSAASEGAERFMRIDFAEDPEDDIDVQDRRFAAGFPLLSPNLAVEMLEGVLTGSIDRVGTERVGGAQTTHYSGKAAPEEVTQEIDDDDRAAGIERIFETLGVNEEVIPVQVWIDEEGRPRRVRFVLLQQQDRGNKFSLTMRYDFSAFGTEADIELPSGAVRTDDFQTFVTEFVRERVTFG